MADMPPDTARPGRDINPGATVLIKIAGLIVLALAVVPFVFTVMLAIAFGGSESIVSGLLRTPTTWIFLLIAAGGVGLIVHARKRERLHRQSRNERFRRA